jgi:DNA repair exonuclease SbcCD ATPase subunit
MGLLREEVARVEGELREYRARAHVLLQRKEAELRHKLSGSSAPEDVNSLRVAAEEAQAMLQQVSPTPHSRMLCFQFWGCSLMSLFELLVLCGVGQASAERDQMARQLAEMEEKWATESEELRAEVASREEELRAEVAAARAGTERAANAADALRGRCAHLEEELSEALELLAGAQQQHKVTGHHPKPQCKEGHSVQVEVHETQSTAVKIVQVRGCPCAPQCCVGK